MSFLAPALLAGLAAMVIPVLIHLTERERSQVVAFPSLMFIRKIPHQSVKRRRLRHLLLLLVRAAAVALLVFAFARPFLAGAAGAATGQDTAREVVVLLDRSYSMGYEGRWSDAQAAARRIVEGLGPEDRASLVLFGRGAEAVGRSTTDRARLLSAIDGAEPGPEATRFGAALKLAEGLLRESPLPAREVHLVSDFQQNAWDRSEPLVLPPGARLIPVPIGEPGAGEPNAGVASVDFTRELFADRERVTVEATIRNRGAGAVRRQATLELEGRALETKPVDLGPDGVATVTFAPVALAGPFTRSTVRIDADALPADDAFHVVLSPNRPVRVVLVGGGQRRDVNLFLLRALAVGREPSFSVETVGAGSLTPQALQDRSVVILNDVAPGPRDLEVLQTFVENGGGVLAALGERAGWADGAALLGFTPGEPRDAPVARGTTLGFVDYAHPIFEPFATPHSGDLSTGRFYRYRSLEPAAEGVLARLSDGTPALVERRVGQGRVLIWTSSLDTFWSDLALKPVFVPFVHEAVKHLAQYAPSPAWMTVGDVLDVSKQRLIPLARSASPATLVAPSGERRPLRDADETRAVDLAEAGFYEVRIEDTTGPAPVLAVNVDRSEADLQRLNPEELAAAVTHRGEEALSADASALGPEAQERRQGWWRYLLLAAFVLLGFETVLANRLQAAR